MVAVSSSHTHYYYKLPFLDLYILLSIEKSYISINDLITSSYWILKIMVFYNDPQ